MKTYKISQYKKTYNRSGGFTLIELLVVVAIIGLLSSIVTVSVSSARNKALDTERMETMRQLEIQANIAILEKKAIPVVADLSHSPTLAKTKVLTDEERHVSIMKYVGILPEEVFASSDPINMDRNINFKKLFDSSNSTNQPFFRSGMKIPEDPKCNGVDASTCYRAWYNGESLVIATTLRTKSHTTGKRLQYGVVIGKNDYTTLQAACKYMGYPRYNTASDVVPGDSNPACTGTVPVSAIQGITSGLDVTGSTGNDTGYGYESL
jgi:prepilin-type N-terminal cleavage/methylation domain-containing protein